METLLASEKILSTKDILSSTGSVNDRVNELIMSRGVCLDVIQLKGDPSIDLSTGYIGEKELNHPVSGDEAVHSWLDAKKSTVSVT